MGVLKAKVDGAWVEVGGVADAVWTGPSAPTDPTIDLWIDTDEPAYVPTGFTPLVPAQFSWVNQGTATVTDLNGVSLLETPSATTNVRLRWKTPPATPYTITAVMEPYTHQTATNSECGIMLRESATDKMAGVCLRDGPWASTIRYGNVTGAGITAPVDRAYAFRRVWLRITNSGTMLTFFFSADGVIFRQLESITMATAFTTAPNQAGYFVCGRNQSAAASFLSWNET